MNIYVRTVTSINIFDGSSNKILRTCVCKKTVENRVFHEIVDICKNLTCINNLMVVQTIIFGNMCFQKKKVEKKSIP